MKNEVIQRYAPFLHHYAAGGLAASLPAPALEALSSQEQDIIQELDAIWQRSDLGYRSLGPSDFLISLGRDPRWATYLDQAYSARAASWSPSSPLPLFDPRCPAQPVVAAVAPALPSAMPPSRPSSSSPADLANADLDAKVTQVKADAASYRTLANDEFLAQKTRLKQILLIEDQARSKTKLEKGPALEAEVLTAVHNNLLVSASPEELLAVARLTKAGDRRSELAVEREAMYLVEAHKSKSDSFYLSLYYVRFDENDKKLKNAVNAEQAKCKGYKSQGILSRLANWLPISVFSIIKELRGARAEGHRTKKNFLGMVAMMLSLSLPVMMATSAFFGLSGTLGTVLSLGTPLLLPLFVKLAVAIGLGVLVANPVGAAIVAGLLALLMFTAVAVVTYRVVNAISAKRDPMAQLNAMTTIDPNIRKIYKDEGYDIGLVEAAVKDLASRILILQGKNDPEAAEKLAKAKQQLTALKGHYAGMLFDTDPVKSAGERFSMARNAVADYCVDLKLEPTALFDPARLLHDAGQRKDIIYSFEKPSASPAASVASSSSQSLGVSSSATSGSQLGSGGSASPRITMADVMAGNTGYARSAFGAARERDSAAPSAGKVP